MRGSLELGKKKSVYETIDAQVKTVDTAWRDVTSSVIS
jgi:hypothetical protein